jgi:Ca2+-binding EF-hand superfamily protein
VAEIKKAFSICDKDGNGVIDASELKDVITNITEEAPTEDELLRIM